MNEVKCIKLLCTEAAQLQHEHSLALKGHVGPTLALCRALLVFAWYSIQHGIPLHLLDICGGFSSLQGLLPLFYFVWNQVQFSKYGKSILHIFTRLH